MASLLLFYKVTAEECESIKPEQPIKMWLATRYCVWPYPRADAMSFFFASHSFEGCEVAVHVQTNHGTEDKSQAQIFLSQIVTLLLLRSWEKDPFTL